MGTTGETMDLLGCNTGLEGVRGWSPAQVFARSQGVATTGERSTTSFSREPDTYHQIDDGDYPYAIYLRAFRISVRYSRAIPPQRYDANGNNLDSSEETR